MARKSGSNADWAAVKLTKKYGERQSKLALLSLWIGMVALIVAVVGLIRTF